MYDKERKESFLLQTNMSKVFGKSVFNTTKQREEELGKDLCEFTTGDLQPVMDTGFGSRTRTVSTAISFIRSYIRWCKEQGYPTNDGIDDVKINMGEKIKKGMVASPAHLEKILDKIFEPVSSGTLDCLYRCFLWMIYAGIKDIDAVEVKTSEIDFDLMTIEHNGKSYEIYREAVPAFKLACTATQFRYINPNYSEEKQGNFRNRFLGEYLLRGFRSPKIQIKTMRAVTYKHFKEGGVETSYNKLRLSGLFYKVYEMERCGEPVNFDGYVVEEMAKEEHHYHTNYTRNKLANTIKRDLENDYACWKEVFTK